MIKIQNNMILVQFGMIQCDMIQFDLIQFDLIQLILIYIEDTIKSTCGRIHNVIPLESCNCSLDFNIVQHDVMMMMMMMVVVERGRMLGWLVSCGARPVKMIGLLTAGDTDSNHTLHIGLCALCRAGLK